MRKVFLHYYQLFSNIGLGHYNSEREKTYVSSFNSFLLVLILPLTFAVISEFYMGHSAGSKYALMFWIFILALMALSFRGKFVIATFLFSISMPLAFVFLHMKYAGVEELFFYFCVLTLLSIVFSISNWRKLFLVAYTIGFYLFAISWTKTNGHFSEFDFDPTTNLMIRCIFFIGAITLGTILVNRSRKNHEQIESLVKSLQNKNEQLKLSNQKLEQFTYLASHDLKAPLNSIGSFVKLIAKRLEDGKLKSVPQYTDIISKSVDQMKLLISQSLAKSTAVDKSKILEKPKAIDLDEIAKLNALTLKANYSNAKITWDHLPVFTAVYSDIYKVFQNLIENGIKYNQSKVAKVHISAITGGRELKLLFKDNGIGIELKDQEIIFNSHQRLNSSNKYEGSGLGLSITKEIIEEMDGSIELSSRKNKGSLFIISLPSKIAI